MDGVKDLLVTTNANGGGKVLAYQLVGDFKQGPSAWKKYVLSDGYVPKNRIAPGAGSPGSATAFRINTKDTESIPMIAVSADDGGWVDVLTPSGNDF